MWIGGLVIGLIAAPFILERCFRNLVAPKIRHIFENVPPFNVTAEPSHSDAESVSFTTSDGIRLHGSVLNGGSPDPPGLVLFLPELRGNHWMAPRYCRTLLDQGYVVLAFDFRNQGESDSMPDYTPIHWITEYEMTDVAAALEFVESDSRLSTLPIIAFGVSRGGAAALLSGCRYPRIRSVIADSAFGTMSMINFFVDRFVQHVIPRWLFQLLPAWHVKMTLRQAVELSEASRRCVYVHLEAEVKDLEAATVLLISGAKDSYVTPEIAAQLHQIVGLQAELWIAAGAKHNMSRSVQTEEYDRRVSSHIIRCLETPVAQSKSKRVEPAELALVIDSDSASS